MNEKKKGSYGSSRQDKLLKKKKNYATPTLSKMGTMQKITLGGSDFPGDSGQGVELINN